MSAEQALRCISLQASGDLSAYQYHYVKIDSNGRVAAAGTGVPIGILQNAPSALGEAATVGFSGVSKVVIGADSTDEGAVMSDSDSEAIAATGAGATVDGHLIKGGDDQEIGEVLLDIRYTLHS